MDTPFLYIGTTGHVSAIAVDSGDEIWRTRLSTGGSVFDSTRRQDVCVLEHEGLVFAGCSGHVFCLAAKDGNILWWNRLPRLGHNDVTLSIAGKSIQVMTRVERQAG